MSENTINPIGNAGLASVAVNLPKVQAQVKSSEVPKAEAVSQETPAVKVEGEQAAISANNVSVSFRINQETNELTVFIMDRESRKLLRTIPSSEFYKMNAGEILHMTA